MAEHLKVKAELKRFADEHNKPIDWNDEKQRKYFILYSYLQECMCVDSGVREKNADTVYFTSEEIVEKAIDFIGKDRLKKYYFGIEG